jgi:Flp pilus assembly protein TadG
MMTRRLRHLRRDERGMTFVWMGIGFMALFAATTLAIDVGMFMTARSQAQNAADGGALAGVTALVFNDWDNRSAGGPAVSSAKTTAQANYVIGSAPSVLDSDVTFPIGPTGLSNRVQVNVFRVANRDNPVATLVGPVFGINTVDISATATAEASPANAVRCAKPFTIPARWDEHSVPANDSFEKYETSGSRKGEILPDADVFPPTTAGGIYWPVGTRMVLRAGTGNQIEASYYQSWVMPGGSLKIGGDKTREDIAYCNKTVLTLDPNNPFYMTQEPGNKVGDIAQGVEELLLKDPNAKWDSTHNRVINSCCNPSPRVFPIPLYDPDAYQDGIIHGRNATLKLVGYLPFFLDELVGSNEVVGYVTKMVGEIDPNAGPAPADSMIYAIRLVK